MRFSKIINTKQKGNVPRASKGFTLIELLVVIGILAVLLAITLIAINPAKQFSQANNTKRLSDINAILNAINQYMADNTGTIPIEITTTPLDISNTGANICTKLSSAYIAALPSDPQQGVPKGTIPSPCPATYNTAYQVVKTSANRITVSAPFTEAPPAAAAFSVTR